MKEAGNWKGHSKTLIMDTDETVRRFWEDLAEVGHIVDVSWRRAEVAVFKSPTFQTRWVQGHCAHPHLVSAPFGVFLSNFPQQSAFIRLLRYPWYSDPQHHDTVRIYISLVVKTSRTDCASRPRR